MMTSQAELKLHNPFVEPVFLEIKFQLLITIYHEIWLMEHVIVLTDLVTCV